MILELKKSEGFELERKSYFEIPTPPGILESIPNILTLGFCPNVPKGYVYCVSSLDPRRICPNVKTCPGKLRGLVSKDKLFEFEKKLGEVEMRKVLKDKEVEEFKKIQEEKQKEQLKELQKLDPFTGLKNFIFSPLGIALIGGVGIILILLMSKKK